jgi:hypothetical protein
MSETQTPQPVDPSAAAPATLSNDDLASALHAALSLPEGHPAEGLLMEVVARLRASGELDTEDKAVAVNQTSVGTAYGATFLDGIEHAAKFVEAGALGWLTGRAQQVAALIRDSGKAAASKQ